MLTDQKFIVCSKKERNIQIYNNAEILELETD